MTCADTTWLLPTLALSLAIAGLGGAALAAALAARTAAEAETASTRHALDVVRRASRMHAAGNVDGARELLICNGLSPDDQT